MKRLITYILFSLAGIASVMAQQNGKSKKNEEQNVFIKPNVRAWRMADQYTIADSIPVDTLTDGHQINNKIWKENVMNVTLGNLGSPYQSMFYLTKSRTQGNIFYNSLQEYLDSPDKLVYYNTKTPYTNLAYTMGYPKRRSEEFVQVLFTQNVNRKLNVGVHYKFSTSIGRYESQRADNAGVRLFSSYDGDIYRYQFSAMYNRTEVKENGGIVNDNYILYPDSFAYDKADDMPVNFMDQKNRISTYQLLYAHQLDLATIERMDLTDSTIYDVPVATACHKIHLLKSHREFKIDNLSTYASKIDSLFPAVINDPYQTRDSVRYSQVSNIFQLKLNEEFNSLFNFGLRAYIGNDVRRYHWPDTSTVTYDENEKMVLHYHTNHYTKVSSYIGGQIFKNRGEHFMMSAGAKVYFQGYSGDFTIDGKINSIFNIGKLETSVWAKVMVEMRSPEQWEEHYCSNHYYWENSFDKTKTINISGGIRIPRFNLELTAFSGTTAGKIYYDENGMPKQKKRDDDNDKNQVVQVTGAYLSGHFSIIGFHTVDRVAVQKTGDMEVEPLPLFALYTSNYYENLFFKVLTLQIGFDWRYNTKYYAPQYVPATMQFAAQKVREVGGYHYLDPFVNMQLKRARIYVKYEHINSLWTSKDAEKRNSFHTIHYPANPGFFKFGLSWNFYD